MDMQLNAPAAAFHAVIARLSPHDRALIDAAAEPAAAATIEAASHWDFSLPAERVSAVLGPQATDAARRGLIACWALGVVDRAQAARMPDEVMALYPFWLDKLATFLSEASGPYDPDFWAKDVRFALALSVPGARSQVIDLSSPMGPGQVARHVLGGWGLGALSGYLKAGGRGTWLEVHTESRHLDDFNEDGWNRAWATAAAICKVRPELKGMIGSSWFYDPPLTEISPRLAHLRLNPLNGGGFMVHQGPAEIHTLRASTASPTRKALIDNGEYTARSWLMVWPRQPLIAWAEARSAQA
jgi:hypothetical protein